MAVVLGMSFSRIHLGDGINQEWRHLIGRRIMTRFLFPTVGTKETINVNVLRTGDDNAITMLIHIHSVKVRDQAHLVGGRRCLGGKLEFFANDVKDLLGNLGRWSSKGEIINLTKQKDWNTFKVTAVDGFIMGGRQKVQTFGR